MIDSPGSTTGTDYPPGRRVSPIANDEELVASGQPVSAPKAHQPLEFDRTFISR